MGMELGKYGIMVVVVVRGLLKIDFMLVLKSDEEV